MSDKCSCGKWYANKDGVKLCKQNGHSKETVHMARLQFRHFLEPEFTVVCAVCNVPVKSYIRQVESKFEFNVLPHVCEVDELTEGAITNEQ